MRIKNILYFHLNNANNLDTTAPSENIFTNKIRKCEIILELSQKSNFLLEQTNVGNTDEYFNDQWLPIYYTSEKH